MRSNTHNRIRLGLLSSGENEQLIGEVAEIAMSVIRVAWLPNRMIKNLWEHRDLIRELIKRELNQRYRGSFLGIVWSIIIPLLMLVIYTFIFSFVFKARWAGILEETPPQVYALILFAGITPFTVFSETLNKSSTLIVGVPNYVKKVVFPLEIFPVVVVGTALLTSLISVVLVIIANLIVLGNFSSTLYLLPLAYLPLILLCLSLGWIVSSLGVYVRDTAQAVPILVQILLFTSPIFYPITAVPPAFQKILALNPLTIIIEGFRRVLLWGQPLSWLSWGAWTVITLVLAILGYIWFMWTKKGFADVI